MEIIVILMGNPLIFPTILLSPLMFSLICINIYILIICLTNNRINENFLGFDKVQSFEVFDMVI